MPKRSPAILSVDVFGRGFLPADDAEHLVWVTLNQRGVAVALARSERLPAQDLARVALAVAPAWRGVGLGAALLRLLAQALWASGT